MHTTVCATILYIGMHSVVTRPTRGGGSEHKRLFKMENLDIFGEHSFVDNMKRQQALCENAYMHAHV